MGELGMRTPFGYVSALPSRFLLFQMGVTLLAGAGAMWAGYRGQSVSLGLFTALGIVVTLFCLACSVDVRGGDGDD